MKATIAVLAAATACWQVERTSVETQIATTPDIAWTWSSKDTFDGYVQRLYPQVAAAVNMPAQVTLDCRLSGPKLSPKDCRVREETPKDAGLGQTLAKAMMLLRAEPETAHQGEPVAVTVAIHVDKGSYRYLCSAYQLTLSDLTPERRKEVLAGRIAHGDPARFDLGWAKALLKLAEMNRRDDEAMFKIAAADCHDGGTQGPFDLLWVFGDGP